jgi:hypothetical protein
MFRLNRVHEPYRAKCEFKSAVPDSPSEVACAPPSRSSDKKEIVYLPGERLLLKLNKSAKKEKKKKMIPELKETDVEYLSDRMNLILNAF